MRRGTNDLSAVEDENDFVAILTGLEAVVRIVDVRDGGEVDEVPNRRFPIDLRETRMVGCCP